MTIILTTTALISIFSFFFYKTIHHYRYVFYGMVAILALIYGGEEANIVSMGYVPFGVFIVVMFSGVMDKGTLRKRLFMVRAELAVIGTILLFPHALGYLEYYLDDIGLFGGGISFYFGLLAAVIVIPLFVTSFQFIRKHMGYKKWKKLHQLSYVFYLSIGLHLILIQNQRMWLYILLFGMYFILKLVTYYAYKMKNRKTNN
ncbi:MAG: ferric reductase-like transmembrane domain-containing protein [Candidatus Izemoplasmataceae bacterium]